MGGVPLRKALHAEGFIKRKMVRTEKVRGGRNGWSSSAVWQKKASICMASFKHRGNLKGFT